VELGELELGEVDGEAELGDAEFVSPGREGDVLLSSGFVEFTLLLLLLPLAPGVLDVLSGDVTPGVLGVVLPGCAPGVALGVDAPG